jgi:hypothetical protein
MNLPFMKTLLASLIRHALTAAGMVGLLTDAQVNDAVSAIMLLAGIVWAAVDKYRRTEAA